MKKAGITDYREFCKDILTHVTDKSLSFEVFSDEFEDMERQALEIASWGDNVYVKIPISNTKGESSVPLVKRLARRGVKVNVTALMTLTQVRDVVQVLKSGGAQLRFGVCGPDRRYRPPLRSRSCPRPSRCSKVAPLPPS